MKQNLGELTPKTYESYVDSHGRTIIPNFKTKTAYIVQKEDEKKFYVLSNRYSIVVAIIMITGFYWDWTFAVISGVVLFVATEIYYRNFFLANLQQVHNVEFPPKKGIYAVALETPKKKRWIRLVMLVAFAILILVNMFMTIKDWNNVLTFSDANDVILVLFSIGLAIFSVYAAIQFIRVMISDKE